MENRCVHPSGSVFAGASHFDEVSVHIDGDPNFGISYPVRYLMRSEPTFFSVLDRSRIPVLEITSFRRHNMNVRFIMGPVSF